MRFLVVKGSLVLHVEEGLLTGNIQANAGKADFKGWQAIPGMPRPHFPRVL
jgi:hypothetical protein